MAVGGNQVEEWAAVGSHFSFEAAFIGAVLLDRLDAVDAVSLGLVALAGEDDLAVGGLQVELELAVLPSSNFEFAHDIAI